MEESVSQRVHAKSRDGIDRVDIAEHVVPLEDLMQKNAVEKSPRPIPRIMPGKVRGSTAYFCAARVDSNGIVVTSYCGVERSQNL